MSRKLLNRLSIAASYFRHKTVLHRGPIEITLESTAKCNLYCPMCPRAIYTFDNENMDLALYRRIVEGCKEHVEFVWAYGIGEPMLHPNIFEMVRVAREAGLRTGLSTNATLLDDSRAEMLLDCGLDYVILAFDGATKETYERYRIGASFEKTRANILSFLKRKQARESRIHVVLQMVLLRENMSELKAFKELWSTPGVNEIRFKRDEVQIGDSASPHSRLEGRRRNPCHLLWRGPLHVRYDGLVHPCCYMYREKPIGDLKTQSLMNIWNCDAMVRLRQAHISGNVEDYPACQSCQGPRPSLASFYGSLAFNSLAVRKAVPAFEKLSMFYGLRVFEKPKPSASDEA